MLRKKKLYAFVSVLTISALVIGGTFAWTNFASSIINSFLGSGAGNVSQTEGPGGTLHNDTADDEPFRDVYVENWGTEPLIVRIHLSEFMEIGEGAGESENNQAVSLIDGATLDDVTSWEPFNGNLDAVLRRDGNTTTETFSDFWQWTMGGQKHFIPAPEDLRGSVDANGVDFVSTGSPFFVNEDDNLENMRQTLNAEVMMMSEWVESMQLGHFWVVDTDGYSYWASPLLPNEATGLLLHKVELIEQPAYDYFYAINVAAHMATVDDAPDNYQRMIYDASSNAETLINMLANTIRDDELSTSTVEPGDIIYVDGRGWVATLFYSSDEGLTASSSNADFMKLIGIDFIHETRLPATDLSTVGHWNLAQEEMNSWYRDNLQGEIIGQYAVVGSHLDFLPTGQSGTDNVVSKPSREAIIHHDAVLQSLSENIPQQIANRTPANENDFAFWTRTVGYTNNRLGSRTVAGNVIFRADDMFASGVLSPVRPSEIPQQQWVGVLWPPPYNLYSYLGVSHYVRPAIWVRTEFAAHSS